METKYYLFSLLLFFLSSCQNKEKQGSENFDYLYQPIYSSGFDIKENINSGIRIISVYNPWQGAKNLSTNIVIANQDFDSENKELQVLKDKAERIICMSSTHIAILDALGAVDKIVGVSGKQYVSNPYIQQNPEIKDIGYEGNINYEVLLATQPDIVLLFSVNGSSSMEPKLKELGIPFIYIGDYVEEDPLGKAEWIVPIAELIGTRDKGIEIFKKISVKYEALKDFVKTQELKEPKVMVNSPFGDSWFMPSTESYIAHLISDAGAEYIYKKNTGNISMPIDTEEALKLVSEADFWINSGTLSTKKELIDNFPKFANSQCVINGKVYNNNYRITSGGGNDCYESGAINPDIVLRDLIKIFHPELIEEDFVYYHQLQ